MKIKDVAREAKYEDRGHFVVSCLVNESNFEELDRVKIFVQCWQTCQIALKYQRNDRQSNVIENWVHVDLV